MKKPFIISFILLSFTTIIAQQPSNLDKSYFTIEGNKLIDSKIVVDGTPYLHPFMNAKVEGVQGTTKMRYNAYNDEVEYQTESGNLALLKLAKFSDIYFLEQGLHLKLVTYEYNKTPITGYLFELVNKPEIKIYKREHITFNAEKAARTSYNTATPASFSHDKPVYFIQKGAGAIVELPSNKRKLTELFPAKKDAINQLFKSNNIDFSNTSDLEKLADIL